ncbi:hypothetical protein VPNG_05711 [Cytospora leucostoma]|uniref:Uncharacterized protein n=1 Tax=Cytospora leucostoma TaxID=1230097 RepID=A0A423X090_9PEZI|nr:hypothetical protein VPNG_05711 [Cytospora leucostoma]
MEKGLDLTASLYDGVLVPENEFADEDDSDHRDEVENNPSSHFEKDAQAYATEIGICHDKVNIDSIVDDEMANRFIDDL